MIRVNETYVIFGSETDYSACVDMGKTKINNKTGKEEMVTKLVGYYSSISSCLEGIARYEIRENIRNNDMTLQEAIEEIRKINKYFTDCLETLNLEL